MLNAVQATNDILAARQERDLKNFGGGATDDAYRIIGKYFPVYLDLFESKVTEDKTKDGPKGKRKFLYSLPIETLTLVSLEAIITALASPYDAGKNNQEERTFQLRRMGSRIEHECYGHAFREHMAADAARIEKAISNNYGSLKRRMDVIKRVADKNKFVWTEWGDADRQKVAAWCCSVLTEGPLFEMSEEGELFATELAVEETEIVRMSAILRNPRSFPQTGEVKLWETHELHLNDAPYPLVRTYQGTIKKAVERRVRAGEYKQSMEALNHAQSVLWRINKPIAELIAWCYEKGVEVDHIPPKKALPLPKPEKPYDDMNEGEQRKFQKALKKQRVRNKGFVGERIMLKQMLAFADEIGDQPFWTPMNFDTRGRVYALPGFNFQGSDPVRAMFLFNEGQALNEHGVYWLKVHIANCWANDSLDKKPFPERVKWVDDNITKLMHVAAHPKEWTDFWTKADSPFLFVASLQSLAAHYADPSSLCHMPVSFDGSCSGLQHLCAMMRSQEGQFVNLTPAEKPQDIYQKVAEVANDYLKAETDEKYLERAKLLLALEGGKGVTRKLIKRLVMTYAYSSNEFGMKQQLMDDSMREAYDDFLAGLTDECAYGEDFWVTAQYLAKVTRRAIQSIISEPTKAMDFLKTVAGLYAHESKMLVWHTPVGFPAMTRYPNMVTKQVSLFLGNKALRFQPRTATEVPGLKKDKTKSAASPNFVHSMDACHLMMVLLASKAEGIDSVALVHDSFGCLPNEAPRFRDLIRRTFRELYENHDVLEDFRKEALAALDTDKVPEAPVKGSLDLSSIEQSDYCFA